MTNFPAALKALSEAKVEFIVVGAYAAVLQGSAYVTRDIDICYERTPGNMKRLVAALKPHHPRLRGAPAGLPFTFDEKTLAQGMNFTFESDFGDIDLMGELSGIGQFAALARDAVSIDLDGVKIRVASLDAVIRSKRAAGRAKDLSILPELEALKELQDVKDPRKRQKK
jgi:predicted nucleotidyltransferase